MNFLDCSHLVFYVLTFNKRMYTSKANGGALILDNRRQEKIKYVKRKLLKVLRKYE